MSSTVLTRPSTPSHARGRLAILAYRIGLTLVDWAERPRERRPRSPRMDLARLARAEERRADARFAEPLGLHHWIR
ncbi:hypothetical protein RBS60_13185 [Sinomonas sp. ASV486]|uniref:hypothetical protein n=1 Tax=Sinomonas sp. ASV486 TaxID=3051170 RepID=UPI0027DD8E73|nr:hypothetical protein [Sinomonas sp. ASV486]MDQ4491151.1 hypothetical protein [Sinomonas sp. ASV486]